MDIDYEDIIAEFENSTNHTDISAAILGHHISLDIITLIICLLSIAVDALTIYIIAAYKSLHKPVNIYILNWLICDLITILFEPSLWRLGSIMENTVMSLEFYCVVSSLICVSRCLCVGFMILMCLHWFFGRTRFTLFEEGQVVVLAIIWPTSFLLSLVLAHQCPPDFDSIFFNLHEYALVAFVLVFAVMLIILQCMRKCANPFNSAKSTLSIALMTFYALCWSTLLLVMFLIQLVMRHYEPIIYMQQVAIFTLYCYPMMLFRIFYKMDAKFAKCVRHLFRIQNASENSIDTTVEDGNENDFQVRYSA